MKLQDVTSETVLDGKFITVRNILTASADVYSINNEGWSLLAIKGTQVYDWDKTKATFEDFIKVPDTKGTLVVDFGTDGKTVSILQPYDFHNVYESYNGIKKFDFVGTNKGTVLLQAVMQYLKAKYSIVDYDPDLNIYSLEDLVGMVEDTPQSQATASTLSSGSSSSKSTASPSSTITSSTTSSSTDK